MLIAISLAGCATDPRGEVVVDYPLGSRPNGQPRALPCMIGDALCSARVR